MKDHEIRELVNQLRDIAIEYHGTQQLRELIARAVRVAMLHAQSDDDGKPTDDERIMAIEGIIPTISAGNSPLIPEGYVMVPKEPTEAMINAWLSEVANWRGHVAGYKAMLAAAPQELK